MSNLFSFHGRIRRSEWWLTRLIILGGLAFNWAFLVAVGSASTADDGGPLALFLFPVLLAGFVAVLWIDVAAGVKRLHDLDMTGWMYLLVLIPFIGGLFALIALGFMDGTAGPNDYGPSAKYPDRTRLAAMLYD